MEICKGFDLGDVVFTIRDNKICKGRDLGDVAFTIRGNEICKGFDLGDAVFTIRDDKICKGRDLGNVVFTIRDGDIMDFLHALNLSKQANITQNKTSKNESRGKSKNINPYAELGESAGNMLFDKVITPLFVAILRKMKELFK